jgi:hypothetical protein
MQLTITVAAVCVAAAAIMFTVHAFSQERNARLVEIGVGILRVDPEKEAQVSDARKWALDLIDANAGVKFSTAAREALLSKRLGGYSERIDYYPNTYIDEYPNTYSTKPAVPIPPRQRLPQPN